MPDFSRNLTLPPSLCIGLKTANPGRCQCSFFSPRFNPPKLLMLNQEFLWVNYIFCSGENVNYLSDYHPLNPPRGFAATVGACALPRPRLSPLHDLHHVSFVFFIESFPVMIFLVNNGPAPHVPFFLPSYVLHSLPTISSSLCN